MKVEMREHSCIVTREEGDKRISGGERNAAGESQLLHQVKQELIAKGYDLIKKRMWKDGHLVDDLQQYLRTRKASGDPAKDVYIYNGHWAIEGADSTYNELGSVALTVISSVFTDTSRSISA
jgi:hypothetical protein